MRWRILVVDDDPTVLEVVKAVLTADGFQVEVAEDGSAALRRILDAPPALVVLDVNMPDLNGWELCDIVRRQSHTRDVPILFLTGRSDAADRITAMQVGGSDHLQKPFGTEELRNRVRALARDLPRIKDRR